MRATIHQVQKKNYTWIIVLILFVIPIVVELLWGEILFNETHESIVSAQSFMFNLTKLKAFDISEDTNIKP